MCSVMHKHDKASEKPREKEADPLESDVMEEALRQHSLTCSHMGSV